MWKKFFDIWTNWFGWQKEDWLAAEEILIEANVLTFLQPDSFSY